MKYFIKILLFLQAGAQHPRISLENLLRCIFLLVVLERANCSTAPRTSDSRLICFSSLPSSLGISEELSTIPIPRTALCFHCWCQQHFRWSFDSQLPALHFPGSRWCLELRAGAKPSTFLHKDQLPCCEMCCGHNMAWHGTAWHCITWHSTAWHRMAWNGTLWHCVAWHCTVWPLCWAAVLVAKGTHQCGVCHVLKDPHMSSRYLLHAHPTPP